MGRSDVGRDDVHRADLQRRHRGAADGGAAAVSRAEGRRQKAKRQQRGAEALQRGLPLRAADLMELTGRVAFVTGGSGDVGGAIAKALARAGADVAISYVGHLDGAVATASCRRGCRQAQCQRAARSARSRVDRLGCRGRRRPARAARHPRQQCGLEHRHSVPGSRCADRGDLESRARDQSAWAISALARRGASPARATAPAASSTSRRSAGWRRRAAASRTPRARPDSSI